MLVRKKREFSDFLFLLQKNIDERIFDNYNKRGRVLDNIIRMMKDKGYIENSMNERIYLDKSVMFLIDEEVNNKVGFAAS